MSKQHQQEDSQKQPAPQASMLPKAMEKRVSLKWATMDALQNVVQRLAAQGGTESRVVLLTAHGQVEGRLCELKTSYAESFTAQDPHGTLEPDVASMVTHVRSELLRIMEQEESKLEIVDTAPIVSLTDVVIRHGGTETKLPQLALFADQVIGFTVATIPHLH